MPKLKESALAFDILLPNHSSILFDKPPSEAESNTLIYLFRARSPRTDYADVLMLK